MPQVISPDDPRLGWQGAISLQREAGTVMPWRLPHAELPLYPFETLHDRASRPAGVRMAFRSDTRHLAGRLGEAMGEARLDLCVDGELVASLDLEGATGFRFPELPAGEKLLELWLPQFHPFRLAALELDAGASLTPDERARPRWTTYGSSITQCKAAASPARTWPALVAREHDLDLTCLGFSSQCHLEPMLARLVRDTPADLISLCLGINVQGGASLSERTLRPAVIGFVKLVREKHPTTPLAVISPIFAPQREATPNAVGLDLRRMRQEVRAAVETLQAFGDDHLTYVDGLELFGPELGHLLPDDLHPSAEGYEVLARRFSELVMPALRPA